MTNELMKNDFNQAIGQVSSIQQLATILLKTPHFKKMGEEGIYSILFACQSLGVDPFQGLNGAFYYLQGKVGMSTELMASLIRRAGHRIEQHPDSGATFCSLTGKRKDNGTEWTVKFSMVDAEKAGLAGKDVWRKYPSVMLYNRAMAILARQLFPDVIKGYGYCEDEIKEIAESKAIDVKPIDNLKDYVKPTPVYEVSTVYIALQEPVKPECTKEEVDSLLELVKQTPQERQENFNKIIADKGWSDPYQMSKRFCDFQSDSARVIIAMNNKEVKNDG